MAGRGALHHLELWVADLTAAEASLGWLLTELGWAPDRTCPHGRSWRLRGLGVPGRHEAGSRGEPASATDRQWPT